jgi:hypothetical protein
MMPEFAPRIHVLLAREAPVGVVIRRGPSKRVCTMLWDRRKDTFHMGQWLKGRIDGQKSDLSPDGKYMIYFAFNGRWKSEARGSWTAVSRAPYLKALALFANGGTYGGGGLFTGARTYWMHDGEPTVRDTTLVTRDLEYKPQRHHGGPYSQRLFRDGWGLAHGGSAERRDQIGGLEKPARRGWVLRKHPCSGSSRPGKGCSWEEHELVHRKTGRSLSFPNWEWADLDGERLVWAAGGKLMAASLGYDGPVEPNELHDFNGMEFEPIAAPY